MNIDNLRPHFPHYRGDFEELQRECSQVDILIGLSDQCLFANKLYTSVIDVNLEIRTGELGNVLSGSYICKQDVPSSDNSISIQIKGQSYHASAIQISELDENATMPEENYQHPGDISVLPKIDCFSNCLGPDRLKDYNVEMECFEQESNMSIDTVPLETTQTSREDIIQSQPMDNIEKSSQPHFKTKIYNPFFNKISSNNKYKKSTKCNVSKYVPFLGLWSKRFTTRKYVHMYMSTYIPWDRGRHDYFCMVYN